ncbi:flagellar M-ring protein FliF [Pacificimonas sp. WHA3]|uniref:Flagellar M-ring protein n=1 Tax=Pacificimonas pallii TaxID=2827236 RepID=A0ABS6SF22_9SPHN|nr:flagellar basal-body MS-ring/collar protein FliF [Pacificimonas pallii]MBV7257003.1 flagellar M-ring protein FliF [Pacificimonas pallii]
MSDTAGTAIIPQRRSNDGSMVATGSAAMAKLPEPVRQAVSSGAFQRIWPTAAALLVVAAILFAVNMLRTPDRVPVFAGLPDAEKSAVMESLTAAGFDADLDPATGAPSVPRADLHRARMTLAAAGLPESGASGYDLLTEMPFGTSRAVESARLRQTQETELAQSIQAMRGVKAARVHIAVAEPSAFVRSTAAPSASVFLELADGRVLGEGQIMAIGHLVSSSVPGLVAERVSIVDQRGTLMSQRGGSGAIADRELDYRERLEQQWRDRIAAIMTPLYGQGGYTAEVALAIDFTATESTSETFGKAAALRSEQRSARPAGDGGNGAARGIPGTLSNQPPPAAQLTEGGGEDGGEGETPPDAARASASGMDESYTRNYELDKQVAVTRAPTGTIMNASVAVVIRDGEKKITDSDIAAAQALLGGALGINEERGDRLVVQAHSFGPNTAEVEPLPIYEQGWVKDWASLAVVLILGLVALFVVAKPLLRAVTAPAAKAGGGDDDAAQLLAATQAQALQAPREMTPYTEKIEKLRELVNEDRDRAFGSISKLLKTDGKAAANG